MSIPSRLRRPHARTATRSFPCEFLLVATLAIGSVTWPRALPAQADSLTLPALLADVERASPRLRASAATLRAASAREGIVGPLPDPQLQLGVMGYSVPDWRPMAPVSMRQLQVMQMVPLAGRLAARRDAASAETRAATAGHGEETLALRRVAAEQFFELRRLERGIEITRESLRVTLALRETALAMVRADEGRQSDVLQADAAAARMRADLERMLAMRRARVASINGLRDREPSAPLGTAGAVTFRSTIPTLDSLLALVGRRPALSSADARVAQATALARSARSEIVPDITVGVQVADGRAIGGMRETMASLMLGASLPIFAGSRQRGMREEGEAMLAMARADREMIAADTRAELGAAHADLVQARTLGQMYRERVLPAAQASLDAALAAYRGGSVPFMTVLDAQMALLRDRDAWERLQADEGKAWAMLDALTDSRWLPTDVPQGTEGTDD